MKKLLSLLMAGALCVSLAAVISADDPTEAPYLDYPDMELVAEPDDAGFATLEEAAESIGKTPITEGITFLAGSTGNSDEGPENLWDNDTTTKFCTGTFPTSSMAKLPAPATIDGIIMATANDNSSYNNRSPYEWCIYGSADGENWTPIAYGDDLFFAETDYTYYPAAVTPVENVQYVLFQSEGALSGCFQVSELVLCGTTTGEAATAEEAPTEEATEAPAEEVTEAPAEEPETVEAPAEAETVEAPAEAAPQTFDMGIIAAVTAVVSLGGYAVAKKH